MTKEIIEVAKTLVANKNTKAVEIINWQYDDGSGNNFTILCDNGMVYDLHEVGGKVIRSGSSVRSFDKRYSLTKENKTQWKNIINGCYKLFNLTKINIIERIIL